MYKRKLIIYSQDVESHQCKFQLCILWYLGPPSCSLKFERVGCYHDSQKKPRPLPHYILTDRDKNHKHYNGTDIDWWNWNTYMPAFACRCAQRAKSYGYRVFGVQYFGRYRTASISLYLLSMLKISLPEVSINCHYLSP